MCNVAQTHNLNFLKILTILRLVEKGENLLKQKEKKDTIFKNLTLWGEIYIRNHL